MSPPPKTPNGIRAAIDWGSSGFRACRFDEDSNIIDRVIADDGIKHSADKGFEQVMFSHIGHWLSPGDSVLLSGMITSRTGWLETPYIHCPAQPASDISTLATITAREIQLFFMPGLCQGIPHSDVMRGEELQVLGACAGHEAALVILPGTHSKWALCNGLTIEAFRTIPTGEILDSLVRHTLIGAFADSTQWDDQTFLQAVKTGYNEAAIIGQLFSARASVLLQEMEESCAYAYLSGLLIGNEVREGSGFSDKHNSSRLPIMLIGSGRLCELYQTALDSLDFTISDTQTSASEAGFTRLLKQLPASV